MGPGSHRTGTPGRRAHEFKNANADGSEPGHRWAATLCDNVQGAWGGSCSAGPASAGRGRATSSMPANKELRLSLATGPDRQPPGPGPGSGAPWGASEAAGPRSDPASGGSEPASLVSASVVSPRAGRGHSARGGGAAGPLGDSRVAVRGWRKARPPERGTASASRSNGPARAASGPGSSRSLCAGRCWRQEASKCLRVWPAGEEGPGEARGHTLPGALSPSRLRPSTGPRAARVPGHPCVPTDASNPPPPRPLPGSSPPHPPADAAAGGAAQQRQPWRGQMCRTLTLQEDPREATRAPVGGHTAAPRPRRRVTQGPATKGPHFQWPHGKGTGAEGCQWAMVTWGPAVGTESRRPPHSPGTSGEGARGGGTASALKELRVWEPRTAQEPCATRGGKEQKNRPSSQGGLPAGSGV